MKYCEICNRAFRIRGDSPNGTYMLPLRGPKDKTCSKPCSKLKNRIDSRIQAKRRYYVLKHAKNNLFENT